MEIDTLTGLVVNQCVKIHSRIGPGCYEYVYEEILCYKLSRLECNVKRQHLLSIDYDDLCIERAYKIDMLIDDRLVLELKTQDPISPVSFEQLRNYLSLTGLKHGLLLNFKVPLMKQGIYRIFNNRGRED